MTNKHMGQIYRDIADAILEEITMDEVVDRYPPVAVLPNHEMNCPACRADFGCHYTDFGFECEYCNETGSPIDYVRMVRKLPSDYDAVRMLYRDFHFGVRTERNQNKAARLQEKRRKLFQRREHFHNIRSNLEYAQRCGAIGREISRRDWDGRFDDALRQIATINDKLRELRSGGDSE